MDVKRIYNKNNSYSTTCPNCGASIVSDKCPYCGTVFIDFACMDADKPFYMKIKHNGKIFISKVFLSSIGIESDISSFTPYKHITADFEIFKIYENEFNMEV